MEFFYIKPQSIEPNTCNKIISLFENMPLQQKYEGVTLSGKNKNIKDTTDYNIPKNISELSNQYDTQMYEINLILKKTLQNALYEYKNQLNTTFKNMSPYMFLNYDFCYDTGFQMQKYDKKIGKFKFHNDYGIHIEYLSYRAITYIWYLNTVDEGGETEFFYGFKVKPEIGKLILFPASWTYPHCGHIPMSHDKYIITGWIYVK
jgi:hypothetical protein